MGYAVTDISAQFSFKDILAFIFKPGFLGAAPLHNLVINLLLDEGYASKAPTSADGCVRSKGAHLNFILFSCLPQVWFIFLEGPFKYPRYMHATSWSVKIM